MPCRPIVNRREMYEVMGLAMNFHNLSTEDQVLVLTFLEMARMECIDRSWTEVEPMLAGCWHRNHRKSSDLTWEDVASYVAPYIESDRVA
jgi:hypothetical protein